MSSMGSMILRSKIESDHLTCSICFSNFTTPKALPCLHTFCEDCLRDYVVSRCFEHAGRFPCPMCRNETQMPPEGVSGFKDNHIVLSLSDTVEKSRRRPPIPPRPQHVPGGFDPGMVSSVQSGTGAVVKTSNLSHPPSRLYPQLPKLQDMPTLEMPSPVPMACTKSLLQRFGHYGPELIDFHRPVGLAIARNGNIVISDHGGYRILIFSSEGKLMKKFGCECSINDLTVTTQNTILVTVKTKSAIMRQYSMDGHLMGEYGSFYRYEYASGIAAMSTGHVAVSGIQNKCVYIFTEQYKFSEKFGRKGSGDDHFLTPFYLATNTKNNIIVSDSQNNNIQVYNSTGKFKQRFGSRGSDHGQLCSPMGICSDSRNNIIVADSGNFRVEMFTPKGCHLECIVEKTDAIGPDVKPVHVGVTLRNDIVVLLVGTQFAEVRIYQSNAASMSQTKFHC